MFKRIFRVCVNMMSAVSEMLLTSDITFFFLKRFIAQTVYTVCTRINYTTVPVTNLNKYGHYGTSGTE